MNIKRFIVEDKEIIPGEEIFLREEDSRHIVKVLRLIIGDNIIISNASGVAYLSVLKNIESKKISVIPKEKFNEDDFFNYTITTVISLPKNSVLDSLLPKLVELGVSNIVLFQGRRSVIKLKDKENKLARLNKIIIESLKQCLRNIKPSVYIFDDFTDCLKGLRKLSKDFISAKKMMFEISNKSTSYRDLLGSAEFNSECSKQDYILLFGSEGGLDESEFNDAVESGFKIISLGKGILKVETAVVAATAVLMNHLGRI